MVGRPKKVESAKTAKVATPKAKKTAVVAKKAADHPTYAVMVLAAVAALKERKGSSKIAIEKYICANYKVGVKFNGPVKAAIKKLVEKKELSQVKGIGANGSFKIAKAEKPVKKTVKKAAPKKSPVKKAPAKKVVKKPVAKKVVKKAPAKKTVKKVAKKTAKKATPKKAKK